MGQWSAATSRSACLYPGDRCADAEARDGPALWMFALVVAYPFLPGSGTDAFKGISVFIGLLISLGSSGVVNQVMSGLTVTYSRALRVGRLRPRGRHRGDRHARGHAGDAGRDHRREAVTIPNAVLISREVINYSKDASASTVFVPASVTIGYDAPWRQIHALLLLAAERTPGIRREPSATRRAGRTRGFLHQVHTLGCASTTRGSGVLTLADLTPTSRTPSTSTACRSCRRTTGADPQTPKVVPKDRWAPPPAGGPPAPGGTGARPGRPGLGSRLNRLTTDGRPLTAGRDLGGRCACRQEHEIEFFTRIH